MQTLIPSLWMMAITYASELTLLSIGFTLTYLTAKIPNFAHGTYAGVGIYLAFTISSVFGYSPYLGYPLGFILGGVISLIVYKLVFGTLARMGGGAIVLTISTLAVQILLTALLNMYTYIVRDITKKYTIGFLLKDADFDIAGFPGIFVVSISLSVVAALALHFLLTRTKTGIAMRACAEDPELSSVLGINIDRIQMFSWFLTGGLACVAGMMIPMWFMSGPGTGAAIITSIMAGSLLGGFENVYGAIVGGFTVGLSEIMLTYTGQQLFGTWFGEYRSIIPMVFLVIVLLIEPRGLQGFYEKYKALRGTGKAKEKKEEAKKE